MKRILFAAIVIFLFISFTGCDNYSKEYYPKDGTWYCDELQVQLCFEPESLAAVNFYEDKLYEQMDDKTYYDSFIMLDGQKFRCSAHCQWDSPYLYIQYDDPRFNDTSYRSYDLGHYFYETEIMSLSDDKMVLNDLNTGEEYIFMRSDMD